MAPISEVDCELVVNTTFPLDRTVATSLNPAAVKALVSASILQFIGLTPRSSAAYRVMAEQGRTPSPVTSLD